MFQELKDKSLKLLELKQQGENDKDLVRMENRKQVGKIVQIRINKSWAKVSNV